jgi:hypothetical protein
MKMCGVIGWRPSLGGVVYNNTVASDNLQYSNDTENAKSSVPYVLATSFPVNSNISGTQRLKFDLKCGSTAPMRAWGQIYKNSVAIGTEFVQTGTVYTTTAEDISTSWVNGDNCQLWVRADASQNAWYKNNRMYFDIV